MSKIKSFGIFDEDGSSCVYKTKEEFMNMISEKIDEAAKKQYEEDINFDVEININMEE